MATTTMPYRLLQFGLDVGCVGNFRFFLHLDCSGITLKNRFHTFEGVLDHVLGSKNDRTMAGGRIRAENDEEVGESVHGQSKVRLWTSTRFHGFDQVSATTALDI